MLFKIIIPVVTVLLVIACSEKRTTAFTLILSLLLSLADTDEWIFNHRSSCPSCMYTAVWHQAFDCMHNSLTGSLSDETPPMPFLDLRSLE